MTRCLALILAMWIAGCAASSGGNECTWAKKSVQDPGFEERWTDREKRAALAHDLKVARFCRD